MLCWNGILLTLDLVFWPGLADPLECQNPILWVSFSWTDSGLCIYNLSIWSSFIHLHNSQQITFPTQSYPVFIIIMIIQVFHTGFNWRFFHGSLSDSKSPQVSRTLFSKQADLNNAVVYITSILPLIFNIPLVLYYYLLVWKFFTPILCDGFHWSLSVSKSPQVSRTLLSILADLNSAFIWMVSTRVLICPVTSPLVTVPSAQISICIIVTFMFPLLLLLLFELITNF